MQRFHWGQQAELQLTRGSHGSGRTHEFNRMDRIGRMTWIGWISVSLSMCFCVTLFSFIVQIVYMCVCVCVCARARTLVAVAPRRKEGVERIAGNFSPESRMHPVQFRMQTFYHMVVIGTNDKAEAERICSN